MRATTKTFIRAERMRRQLTPPEARLWLRLKGRKPGHPVVRRQHPFEPYILDFYCPAAMLAMEVDGAGHSIEAQVEHDVRRDAWLKSKGVEVLRVMAADVMRDPDGVAAAIWDAIVARVEAKG
jgi:very-short-patch-repair endonuclease